MSDWTPLQPFEKPPIFVSQSKGEENAHRDRFLSLDDNRTSLLAHGRQHSMNVVIGVLEHPQGISDFKRQILLEVLTEKKEQQREARDQSAAASAKIEQAKQAKDAEAREEIYRARHAEENAKLRAHYEAREAARDKADRERETRASRRNFWTGVFCTVLGVALTIFAQFLF